MFDSPRILRTVTIRRPYADSVQLIETLEATGSVVATLSTIGTTIVKGR